MTHKILATQLTLHAFAQNILIMLTNPHSIQVDAFTTITINADYIRIPERTRATDVDGVRRNRTALLQDTRQTARQRRVIASSREPSCDLQRRQAPRVLGCA
jgi:hypothetical protein